MGSMGSIQSSLDNGTIHDLEYPLVGFDLRNPGTDLISDPEASTSLLMAESGPSTPRLTLSFLGGAVEAA